MKFFAQNILLIATRHIGDVLLTTPLLRSLRSAYPKACIDALVNGWTADILDGNPDVNNVITVNQDPRFPEYAGPGEENLSSLRPRRFNAHQRSTDPVRFLCSKQPDLPCPPLPPQRRLETMDHAGLGPSLTTGTPIR